MTFGPAALRPQGNSLASQVNIDETTALLTQDDDACQPVSNYHAGEQLDGDVVEGQDNEQDKPLPMDQILALCVARVVEPIAFFSIFPFINQMIWETGQVAETDVGFYSGLIVCLELPMTPFVLP